MRLAGVLVLMAAAFVAPQLKADTIQFTDNYGTASETVPAYYVAGCSGGECSGVDIYLYTVASSTIPATVYIGNPDGYVSDTITTTTGPPGCPVGDPCLATALHFVFLSGLDLTGSPVRCASVGGCNFTYDNSVQDVGTIIWGPGDFTPPDGYSTTFQFQSLTGTLLTASLINFLGGSTSDPVLLPSGQPVASITGTIGGFGSQDYYSFLWYGGCLALPPP